MKMIKHVLSNFLDFYFWFSVTSVAVASETKDDKMGSVFSLLIIVQITYVIIRKLTTSQFEQDVEEYGLSFFGKIKRGFFLWISILVGYIILFAYLGVK